MASKIWLRRRHTHRYQDGWAHMDKHSDLGAAKVLAPRLLDMGNGHDEGPRYRFKVVLDAGIDRKAGAVAVQEYFRAAYTSSCSHAHDCCGCRSAHVNVQHRRGRSYSVLLRITRNY